MPIATADPRHAVVLEVEPIGAAGVLAIVSEALRALGERRDAGAAPGAIAAETEAALVWARAELEHERGAAARYVRTLVALAETHLEDAATAAREEGARAHEG